MNYWSTEIFRYIVSTNAALDHVCACFMRCFNFHIYHTTYYFHTLANISSYTVVVTMNGVALVTKWVTKGDIRDTVSHTCFIRGTISMLEDHHQRHDSFLYFNIFTKLCNWGENYSAKKYHLNLALVSILPILMLQVPISVKPCTSLSPSQLRHF